MPGLMRILFCCEFYAPSVGGVQEVMRQLAERLVVRGHHVTVATTRLLGRKFETLNGVNIKEFDVSGNLVSGMKGEIERYQEYVVTGGFDIVMIKAAQQWTFDALWPVLDEIKFPKVFIPCGFAGLYQPAYAKYFQEMPEILTRFSHLIFYASKYRDIDFARQHGIENFSVIPNGASEIEFCVNADPTFRVSHDISEQSFVFLTVGSFTGLKGHLELVKAFDLMELDAGRDATLILNGNDCAVSKRSISELFRKFIGSVRTYGIQNTFKPMLNGVLQKFGFKAGLNAELDKLASYVNESLSNKHVLLTNFTRPELIQAYLAADLFVFASNIEYSPLVLFEAAAAATPFLSVDVGNSAEIAQWTGAGVVCPSIVDAKGYTRVDEVVLARTMAALMQNEEKLDELGAAGRFNWSERYTWAHIVVQYEQLFSQLVNRKV
jgi:glycosyltransferase involved in cell wall biosynthesis